MGNARGAVCLVGVVIAAIAFVVLSNIIVLNLIARK